MQELPKIVCWGVGECREVLQEQRAVITRYTRVNGLHEWMQALGHVLSFFFSFIKLFRCGLVFSGYDLKAVRDAFQRWRGFVTSHLLAFVWSCSVGLGIKDRQINAILRGQTPKTLLLALLRTPCYAGYPFPNYRFQNESSWKLFTRKWLQFVRRGTHRDNHFHMAGFARILVLTQRPRGSLEMA